VRPSSGADDQDTTLRLLFLLRQLKAVESTLPVEVFHYPGEMTDENQRKDIEGLGATIKEVSKSPKAGRHRAQPNTRSEVWRSKKGCGR
jgi:hypothetical protein